MLFLISESLITESNSILRRAYKNKILDFDVSGSSSQYINGSLQLTKPEYAFDGVDKKYDWCSSCLASYDEHPYIILSVKQNTMNIQGYYIRSGCCNNRYCCCYSTETYCCVCCLYSWSFQISQDNLTWQTVHKGEKDLDLKQCKDKTFKFSTTYKAKYVRLIQDEPCPGDPPCIALNQIELIGNIDGDNNFDAGIENDEEDVSIIGHISKSHGTLN